MRRKDRLTAGQFLAEGRQAVGEALSRAGTVLEVLVAPSAVERHQDLVHRAAVAGVPVSSAPEAALGDLSDTVTPQGILAVCRTIDVPLATALDPAARLIVVCDQIRDPGNLGTVIRCADAFGADAVLVTGDAVDVYNGKTVRASTGSLFHLPVAAGIELGDVVALGRRQGFQLLGADGGASTTVDDLAASGALTRPTVWVLGNEAWGLPPERAALLDQLVALPMYGRAESLNLSTAAAVILYATATAQRAG